MSLEKAFAALREETKAPAPEAATAATRRQILLRTSDRRRKRLVLVRYAVPIAAVLALGTAWAALSNRLSGTWNEPTSAVVDAGVVEAAVIEMPSALDASVVEEEDAAPPSPAPVHVTPRPSAPRVTADPEEDLYRAAHRAHFVAHDEPAALVGWDAYLAKYPDGRFAPEAKYNRAIALVSLGRTSEARAALAPFASGAMGGYRQTEAKALLGALKDRP